jgi:hypothetical protein
LMPWRNTSVLEAGKVSTNEVLSALNAMHPRERQGVKSSFGLIVLVVNSPQRRNPKKAKLAAAANMWPLYVPAVPLCQSWTILLRIGKVIGSRVQLVLA